MLFGLLAVVALLGCGAAAGAGSRASDPPDVPPDPATVPPTEPPARHGTIDRQELDRVLAAGLGRFLQQVETEPFLEDGRFVGFRLIALRGELFRGVDLRPGDTILRVNGMPIERPEEALQVWNGLRVASELTVEFLRATARHQLRFAIAD